MSLNFDASVSNSILSFNECEKPHFYTLMQILCLKILTNTKILIKSRFSVLIRISDKQILSIYSMQKVFFSNKNKQNKSQSFNTENTLNP